MLDSCSIPKLDNSMPPDFKNVGQVLLEVTVHLVPGTIEPKLIPCADNLISSQLISSFTNPTTNCHDLNPS